VSYNGQTIINGTRRKDNVLIAKGGTLEMVLSKSTGGSLTMPDLECKMYDEAVFQLQALQLAVADAVLESDVPDEHEAFVWKQEPLADSRVYTGDTVTLFLASNPPADCNQ